MNIKQAFSSKLNKFIFSKKFQIFLFSFFLLILTIKIINIHEAADFKLTSIENFGFTPEYINIAKNTFEHGYFSKQFPDGQISQEFRREPLYPTILMLTGFAANNFEILFFLQTILLVLTLLIWLTLAYRRFGTASTIFFFILALFNQIPFFYSLIFYPYIINIFFITLGILFLIYGLEKNKNHYLIFTGIFFAIACYERGLYILYPFGISLTLILLSSYNFIKIKIRIKETIYLLLPFLIIIFPWIVRNSINGIYSINGMIGYSLGYTYGSLVTPQEKTIAHKHYNEIIELYGADKGTSDFIDQKIQNENMSFSEADKETTKIILEKIKNNPKKTLERIIANIQTYPSRLGPDFIILKKNNNLSLFDFYVKYASLKKPSFFDYFIILFSIIGIAYKSIKKDALAIISFLTIFYLFIINTTLVTFDPRYRGVSDLIIFLYVFTGVKMSSLYFLSKCKKIYNKIRFA